MVSGVAGITGKIRSEEEGEGGGGGREGGGRRGRGKGGEEGVGEEDGSPWTHSKSYLEK